ncbi:putative threonine efflux protein [Legionella oakridgensis RV-2-2007]|nr:putative threonine efflux protein [Legionella oakridgensis RV-2-2007]
MFPDATEFVFFLTATIILGLTPGNDVLYIASQSLNSFKHGVVATIGVGTGLAIYVIASVLGLSGILMHSPLLFNVIKIIGAFYLFYLAYQAWSYAKKQPNLHQVRVISVWKSYKNGVFTNILNPKVGIFFLTFLPQFVDPGQGKVELQLVTLGGCFLILGTAINFLYVFLFVYLKDRLFSNATAQAFFNKLTAFVFCMLAINVLSSQQR